MTQGSEFAAPLALLREQIAAGNLLPRPYDSYRPLLADALCFFLGRLSPDRLRRMLSEQTELPWSATVAERLVALLVHAPALHKLGQVVARDHRLSESLRRHLRKLESLAPRVPRERVVSLVQRQLKDWRRLGIQLDPHPLAEGSVAIIMPFTCQQGSVGSRAGVLKILKPRIAAKLAEDLDGLSALGEFLDQDCARLGLPALDYRETFSTLRNLLLNEVQFEQEQQNLTDAARWYGSTPGIRIPALFPFCTPRLTAMERVVGRPINALDLKSERATLEPMARRIIQALICAPFFSPNAMALFHADPHGGNLLLAPDGQVGILDWSLTGRLTKAERIHLAQVLLGAITFDLAAMERAVLGLSRKPPDLVALRAVLSVSLRDLRWQRMPGFSWLIHLLDKLVVQAGFRPGVELLLFRKSLLTVAGVAGDLTQTDEKGRTALLDQLVMASFCSHWLSEWPARFQTSFFDRSFGTHLANADLFRALCSAPVGCAFRWNQAGLEMLTQGVLSRTRASALSGALDDPRSMSQPR